MPVNKVVFGNETVMDITDTTATPNSVTEGQVFYDRTGARMLGALGLATEYSDGLMSAVDKAKLNGINVECKTTTEWNATPSYIPPKGAILIYSDHSTMIVNGAEVPVPDIKIGDGNAYGIDLPFLNGSVTEQILNELNTHVNDQIRHITQEERIFWNNKLNYEVVGEQLVLNHS